MSVQLSVALNIAAPIWEKMYFNGVSLERAMRNDLKGEIKGAVQSLLYCALRQRAKCDIILSKLVTKKPSENIQGLLCIALGLLLSGEEKDFVVVDQTVQAAKSNPRTIKASFVLLFHHFSISLKYSFLTIFILKLYISFYINKSFLLFCVIYLLEKCYFT